MSEEYAPLLHRGSGGACTQGKRTQHGKPQCVIRDDQPDAREGQAGRAGAAERLEVPLKPGNAGGGKGPQFKTNATSGRMSSAGASARASAARRASPPDSEAPERPSSLRRYSAR